MFENVQKSMKSILNMVKPKYTFPHEVEDYFTMFKLFLQKSIIDYSLLYSFSDALYNHSSKELFKLLRSEIIKIYSDAYTELTTSNTIKSYFLLINLSLSIFYISQQLIAVKDFYEVFFSTSTNSLFSYLATILPNIKSYSSKYPDITDVIFNILSDTQIKIVMDGYLISNYLAYHSQIISNINSEVLSQEMLSNDCIKMIFNKIYTIDFEYETIFNKLNLSLDDTYCIKASFIQSLIRIVLNKTKSKYISDEDKSKYLLSLYLRQVIEKSTQFYQAKLGKNYHCLYRKEQIFDEILKYITFSFGNNYYLNQFYPFFLELYDMDINENKLLDLTEKFLKFFKTLPQYLPKMIIFILKYIYINVKEVFELEEGNYYPCYMFLFFTFLCSPKMEHAYQINVGSDKKVNTVNKIIMNVCYNQPFKEEKNYFFFNDCIPTLNKALNKTMHDMFENTFAKDDPLYEEDILLKSMKDVFIWKDSEVILNYDCIFINKLISQDANS